MLFTYWKVCLGIGIFFILFLFYCAFSAYRVNAKRQPDNPDKKDYPPQSLWIIPVTPFIWLVRLIILAPWSVVFGIFLIAFPFILIIFRPLPENDPVQRAIHKVGNGVLNLNTKLLRAMGFHAKSIQFFS